MKKIILYLFVAIGVYAVLLFAYNMLINRAGQTSYGGAPAMGSAYPTVEKVNAVPGGSGDSNNNPSASEQVMKGMIIRNANITLEVNDPAKVIDEIMQMAEREGGYAVNSNLRQDSFYVGGNIAQISIRIPSNRLNNVLQNLKSLAVKVIEESITSEDITRQYVDLESELKNYRVAKDQLNKIMQGAKNTSDVLAVYQQLSETQRKIDVIEGQIKYYKESVAYSLITIYLQINPAIKNAQNSTWQISEVVRKSYQALIEHLRQFIYGFIEFVILFVPMILLWGIIALLVFWIGRAVYSRFKQ
ncbi:DUF4349 domain-containing protein [Legionella pneumophila]|uniref:DUF4349 domain-containing protein n=1 Tax=Legionella pneumophila TaxID=446 RepID=A0AAP3MB05_LEGPN|nr:DUF4349 domain-containing protein [Legionella pneumophila]MCZ4690692.1 DUF4349 domain-containing protein [Legionella pneumophila]MCZ4708607.1 DUF4349 domain-containing protein [Legionella pneumophila]MCZ4718798.1 DUF4349 domain-containing protein [Legionella pneumophila]WBA05407.1 hypothetical protein LpnH3D14_01211 [Legionella pneumophila]CZH12562.1 Uncharacterised protein [Legionella pneumophila]